MRRSTPKTAVVVLTAGLTLAACGGSDDGGGSGSGGGGGDAAEATSLDDFGSLDELIAAAQEEGELNVIALPPEWANYGQIISTFEEKYDIRVNSASPNISSQEELSAVQQQRGQDRAPDVLDLATAFARQGQAQDLLAPYRVQTWDEIPEGQKDPEGYWYNDYGGYMSIGCNASIVGECPQTIADLLDPRYAGQVALNGNPTQAGAAFGGVWAAALANGGSLDDIGPGVDFFVELKDAGNFNPIEITPATVESGETPIVLDWDYLNAAYAEGMAAAGTTWEVVVPEDGLFGGYYSQAVSAFAPHPAAARLWQEFLYSDEGQNLWLAGGARPVRLPSMQEAGTADPDALAALPPVQGEAEFPTQEQESAATEVVTARWNEEMSG